MAKKKCVGQGTLACPRWSMVIPSCHSCPMNPYERGRPWLMPALKRTGEKMIAELQAALKRDGKP